MLEFEVKQTEEIATVMIGKVTSHTFDDYIIGDIVSEESNKSLSDYILYNLPRDKRVKVTISLLDE
jgi:hypothetical protein